MHGEIAYLIHHSVLETVIIIMENKNCQEIHFIVIVSLFALVWNGGLVSLS